MGCLLFAGILPSFATLPYAWFVLPFHDLPFPWRDALVEFSVIAMEGAILWSILKMKAFESFKLSFVCNAGSYLTGLLLYKYLRL
ncbi:MAG: hypothetical protein Q8Q08_04420 [Candidatus Omnitrophota bacterium]|nr:hypothetical protein [Candidatus Omnitrophota bacterium]